MYILETERTQIRKFKTDDLNQALRLYSDKDVMKYIGNGEGFSLEDTEVFISKMIKRYEEHGFSFWAVEEKKSNILIGHCGLMLDRNSNFVEIGYTISKEFWRQGLAFEVSKAVLNYAFQVLNLKEVVAFTKKINKPSQEIMKKLEMHYWKEYSKNEVDYVAYKLTAENATAYNMA